VLKILYADNYKHDGGVKLQSSIGKHYYAEFTNGKYAQKYITKFYCYYINFFSSSAYGLQNLEESTRHELFPGHILYFPGRFYASQD
jgi:hypothetical protein